MEKWAGKVAVIIGASDGIGAAIAKDLVRAGMIVVGLAKRKDKIEALRASLFGAPGQLNAFECDVTSEQSVQQAFAWIEKTQGCVQLLINNGGLISKHLFLDDNNIKDLKTMLETSIVALCICAKEAVKSMKNHEVDGHIVNINSIFGHKTNTCVPGTRPLNGMYPATKYAITAMTECLRQEMMFLEANIKVTSISPGLVEDDIIASGSDNEIIKLMPRLKPEDVSEAIQFAITAKENVLIQEVVLKPMGEFL